MVPFLSLAQLSEPGNDTTIYYLNYAATGLVNRTTDGNSYLANNNLRFSIAKKNIVLNTTNSWIYGEQESGLTNNDYSSTIDFNVLKSRKPLYYWGLLTYDKSYSLKINNRFQVGAGIGYTVAQTKNIVLVLSDGPLYETSKLYDTSEYQTVRNSFRVKYRLAFANNFIQLEGTNFLQNSVLKGEDYIIKANNNLSLRINQWLSFTVATTYNKLNLTGKENFLSNIGLRFEKYF